MEAQRAKLTLHYEMKEQIELAKEEAQVKLQKERDQIIVDLRNEFEERLDKLEYQTHKDKTELMDLRPRLAKAAEKNEQDEVR